MQQNMIRNEAYRTTVICVDSYNKGVLAGRYYNVGQEDEVLTFHSLIQLLSGMEKKLNELNYPQSFTAMRSLVPLAEPKLGPLKEASKSKGKIATFSVKILFRQNTSWQGVITWQEKKVEQTFRSVLELILMLDGALGGFEDE
ncbi:MAG: hypothetical protein IKU80_02250 [Firmicutes bacterium]|nr:hypothetical protein [Bacillota bacterium]